MSNTVKGIDWLQQLEGATTLDTASSADTIIGTDDEKAVTPAGLKAALAALGFPIVFNGNFAKGIDFASATPSFTDDDNACIAIGTWNDGIDVTGQTAHYVPIQVHLDSKTSVAKDIAAARLRVDTEAANTLTAVGCLQLRQNLAHNLASSAILNASVNVSAAVAVQTGSLLGGYFSIEGSGAITKAGDNDCTPLVAVNNNTGGGVDNVFVAMMNGTGQSVDEIIKVVCEHGTAGVGVDIEKTANGTALTKGLYIKDAVLGIETSLAAIGAAGRIAKLFGNMAAGNQGDGYGAVEVDLTVSGTMAGHVAGLSSWVNIAADTIGGGAGVYLCAQTNGIYASVEGADDPGEFANTKVVFGMRASAVGVPTDAQKFPFSINTGGVAPITALFDVGDMTEMGVVAGKTLVDEYIPLFKQADGAVKYVKLAN